MSTEVPPPVWLTESDVVDLVDLADAIGAVRAMLELQAGGGAETMGKTHVKWDGATLHALGGTAPGAGLCATKTWAHTGGGATPLLVLWDSETGALLAVIEAFALGQLRTASMSGVATDVLARPDASVLAIVGTGKQALPQVAAVLAVRPIEVVRVHSPDAGHRRSFAETVRSELDITATDHDTVDAAVDGAHVVTLASRAREPFLSPQSPAPGAHVNAIGAITPERAEFDPALLGRASVVAVDDREAALRLSQEMRSYYVDGPGDPETIRPICDLVVTPPTRGATDVTVFKPMGTGLADLAIGAECLRRSRARGLGRPLSAPQRARPRLRRQ